MKTYKITFGVGLSWTYIRHIDVEAYESEQDALDKQIDQLEKDGDEGCFLTREQIESGDYGEDMYIIGGKHGRYLHHHGIFKIEEAT